MKIGPVRKSIAIVGLIFFSVLVVAMIIRFYTNSRLEYATAKFKKDAGPLDAHHYAPPAVMETRNVATWLQAGVNAMIFIGEEPLLFQEMIDAPVEKWTDAQKTRLREALDRNNPSIEILARMLSLQDSSFDLDYRSGPAVSIPRILYKVIQTSKMLKCKTKLDIEENRIADAFGTASIEERIAASLSHEPVVIMGLVGLAVEKDYHEIMHQLLPLTDEKMLVALEAQLSHLQNNSVPVSKLFAAEGAATYQSLQLYGYPRGMSGDPNYRKLRIWYALNSGLFLANSLELYSDFAQKASRPMADVDDQPLSYGKKMIRDAFIPFTTSALQRFQSTASARLLAQVAVQLCRIRLKDGIYPRQLPAQLRISSPYSGESVVYRVLSDGSATLAFPEAVKKWKKGRYQDFLPVRPPRFQWTVPAKFAAS